MDKDRSPKYSNRGYLKKNKKSKKRKYSHDLPPSPIDERSTTTTTFQPLVEYSDVSSDEFSAPEAGEINTDENLPGASSDNKTIAILNDHQNSDKEFRNKQRRYTPDEDDENHHHHDELEVERKVATMSPGEVSRTFKLFFQLFLYFEIISK